MVGEGDAGGGGRWEGGKEREGSPHPKGDRDVFFSPSFFSSLASAGLSEAQAEPQKRHILILYTDALRCLWLDVLS